MPATRLSVKPGREKLRDRSAAAGSDEAPPYAALFHDEQRWHLRHREPGGDVGPLVDVDVLDHERLVVRPPLKHLREVALDAARDAGNSRTSGIS